jgi:hypothetical protein
VGTSAGHRLQWDEVRPDRRDRLEAVLGSPVRLAVGQAGGYGPGLAARCELADGRRVFVKGAAVDQNPHTPGMVRREAVVVAGLPAGAPAPALLHVVDEGDWVALVFDEVPGAHPVSPWDEDELRAVLRATLALGGLEPAASLDTVEAHYGAVFRGWRTLAAEGPGAVVDDWSRRHLGRLADLEARWGEATAGSSLVHGDVRSDNVLLVRPAGSGATAEPDVVFVDWTSTCVGAGWFDVVAMLPSVELEGGGSPEHVLALAGLTIDEDRLVPLVAAIAGYFANTMRLPDPPGLPTVRAFQRAQGGCTLAWLRRLLPWP